MRQHALVAGALALVTFMGLPLRSLEATIRVHDRTTAVLGAPAHMAPLGAWPETGEQEGRLAAPERERLPWSTAVTEHPWDAGAGRQPVMVQHSTMTVAWAAGQQTHPETWEVYGVR